MRLISKAILACVGTAALAGSAYAADRSFHTMKVDAPDGTVVQVRYAGDRQPVAFVPVEATNVQVAPVAVADPFADMDRMFAAMDAQMDAMTRAASTMPATPIDASGKPDLAALKSVPGGTVSYSYYSSSTGANGCTQTVQMTSTGDGAQPKVVRTSAGDCDKAVKPAVPGTTLPVKAEAPKAKAPGRDTI